jgi:hypothetical protein
MNCDRWQERIALFTGGDLALNETALVEAHLGECAECKAFERSLSETRAMLLSLRDVDESQVKAVRSGVLRQLQERRRPAALSWISYAAAIAALAFGITLWRSRVEPRAGVARVAARELVAVQPPVIVPVEKRAAPAKRVRHVRPKPAPAAVSAQDAEPTVVTLYTDDPDVVIVWITD